jgi:hypothetical protein
MWLIVGICIFQKKPKMHRFYTLLLLLVWGTGLQAQKDYKWEKEHVGVLEKPRGNAVPGFASQRIFDILNQIPLIKEPRGFDVREGASVSLSGKVYKGQLMVGFPLYYRWGTGKLQKQGEYYMTHIYINDREELKDVYSYFMSEETDKLKMPAMFTDTFSISYQTINGCTVGMARSRVNQNLYILNPRIRPCFLPVTKEQFIKVWIGKLGLDIAKEKEKAAEFKSQLNDVKENAEALANLKETIKLSELWHSFLLEKKKGYEEKLASFTEAEKKAPAYYTTTTKNRAVLEKKGVYVEKVTGDLPNELAEDTDAKSSAPLFQFNPDFFDPKLPKTAFQLIVMKDGYRQGWKDSDLIPLLQKDFFPLIDFKQLTALMYK